MKNITFVIHMLGVGGAERVAAVLCEEIAKLDGKFKVNVIRYSADHEEYKLSNVNNLYTLPCHKNRLLRVAHRFVSFMRIIWETKTDTLVMLAIGDHMTFMAKKLFGIKLILSQRNDPASEYNDNLKKKAKAIKYFENADCVVFQTDEEKEYFNSSIQEKGVVILNPIKEGLPERVIGERHKIVVNFCRLEPQKNLTLLINAFDEFHKHHDDYQLVIYGEGSERDNLEKLITSLGAENYIEIRPFQKNIHQAIIDAKMFVSTSDYEGISNSMIEAMGIGLPTICTDCPAGGARMVIRDHENGLLVPVGDKAAVISAMEEIVNNSDLAETISRNATDIKKELSVKKICADWMEIL